MKCACAGRRASRCVGGVSTSPAPRTLLVTGGTGYLGSALIPELIVRGHQVRALSRPESRGKIDPRVDVRLGSALAAADVAPALAGADTVVHLVGVPKPSPAKAQQFRAVDLASIEATVRAVAATAPTAHLVYLSVAQPASVMKAYVEVRAQGEAMIRAAGLRATFVRPWYVLGPGHRWPYALIPVYALLRLLPATRASAERLGLVTLRQMTAALVAAVENPADRIRIVDVPAIRRAR